MAKKYNFNKDVVDNFKFNSNYQSKGDTIAEIASYVEVECKVLEEDKQDYRDKLTDLVFPENAIQEQLKNK